MAPDGTTYEVNPEACRIFGMTEEEIIRGGRDEVLDASDPRLRLALEERTSTGKFKGKLNLRRKDGTIFPGEVSTSLFTDRNDLLRTAMIISYIIFITFISTLNPKFDIKLICDDLRENLMINFGNLKEHLKHY
jgi:PAS domain S-box-containing protein